MKLSGVMLGSDNSKQLGEFYSKIFGKPMWQENDWFGFDIGGGGLIIGPHSEVKGSNKTPGRIMFTLESQDVKKDFNSIKAVGSNVIAEPYQPRKDDSPELWLATFADPDNNYFQLASPMKA